MRLPVKITLLLFVIITVFVVAISIYFTREIERNFRSQAQQWMSQSTASIEERLALTKDNLEREMDQLSSSFFQENETTLTSILSDPPQFNPDVINFAEKLRRRTTLDFLYVISARSTIVSNSLQPAAFGKDDPRPDFPPDETAYVFDGQTRIELKKKVQFGGRFLLLRGGYFLKPKLEMLSSAGIQMNLQELPSARTIAEPSQTDIIRNLTLRDYLQRPVMQIHVTASTQELDRQKANLMRNSTTFIAITVLFCLITGYLLSLWISRPVARLQEAAREMSEGNLTVRIQEPGSGEIAALISAFNRMAEQLQEKQDKLLQAERIAAWEEIARHLAHEIKNPLTPIRTSITNLRLCLEKAPEKFPEIFLESSESISEEVEKLRHLADEFSRFARLPSPSPKTGNLNELISRSVLLYQGSNEPKIEFHAGEIPSFAFDAEQISQVLHNLLRNAMEAVNSDGMIKVETGMVALQGRPLVFITVEDNGAGMEEEVRRQVFTPYFTTKERGSGLGLAIVHRIIHDHGGTILIDSAPGRGTKVEVRLPV